MNVLQILIEISTYYINILVSILKNIISKELIINFLIRYYMYLNQKIILYNISLISIRFQCDYLIIITILLILIS